MKKYSKFCKLSLIIFFVVLLVLTHPVFAGEKKATIEFDRSMVCCLMNHDTIAEKLEKVDGINTVHFSLNKRRVLAYYDPSKIKVESIIDRLSEITKVDRKYIAATAK